MYSSPASKQISTSKNGCNGKEESYSSFPRKAAAFDSHGSLHKMWFRRRKKWAVAFLVFSTSVALFLINLLHLSIGINKILSHGLIPFNITATGRLSNNNIRESTERLGHTGSEFDTSSYGGYTTDQQQQGHGEFRWTPAMRVMQDGVPMAKRWHPTIEAITTGELTMKAWVPIEANLVPGQEDVMLTLCELDWASYHAQPELYPMFLDLTMAACTLLRGKTSKVLASDFAKNTSAGRQLQPNGFIFHESRAGSTLIANMLGAIPTNLVYSEPRLLLESLLRAEAAGWSEERQIWLFRTTVLALGRTLYHDHFFIKFQSMGTMKMNIILKAFPNVPWIFVYRDPVEVMVSNLRKNHGMPGPCIRTQFQAPKHIQKILGTDRNGARHISEAEYCAAHLSSLCQIALEYLTAPDTRGRAVGHTQLPNDMTKMIFPVHFNLSFSSNEAARILYMSGIYSKARNKKGYAFTGDGEQKHGKATPEIEAAAIKHLDASWQELQRLSREGREVLEARAKLREQEAYVYERTGSRFFDLPSCPEEPKPPPEVPILDIVHNWNPDDVSIPARHYSTLCRLDYVTEFDKAVRYRDAEVPFVIRNIPELSETVRKWNSPGYLAEKLGNGQYHTEVSKTNHFMYYRSGSRRRGWQPPTTSRRMKYAEWWERASKALYVTGNEEHWYFRVSDTDNPVIREDLTIFAQRESLFMKDPQMQRGVHCRFGMRGVLAEAHFDASRNMVALVSGTRRWLLARPRECAHTYLLPVGHPSARHTAVDWSEPDLTKYPLFRNLTASEVILTPGEVLFVPAWWLHSIVNLDVNIQCNSRSGDSKVGLEDLAACGFNMKVRA